MLEYTQQLQWISSLQETLRSPYLDLFFKGMNYIDTPYFLMVLVGSLISFKSRKLALKIAFIFMLSGLFSSQLKNLFHQPRPCQLDPSVGLICYSSYGLPSGAAQSATLYLSLGWTYLKKFTSRLSLILFCLLLYFSRIYLGQHFFTDILGGLIVGLFLSLIYFKILPNDLKKLAIYAMTASFMTLLISWQYAMLFLGLALGIFNFSKLQLPPKLSQKLQGFSLLILGCFFLSFMGYQFNFSKDLIAFFLAYWFSGASLKTYYLLRRHFN